MKKNKRKIRQVCFGLNTFVSVTCITIALFGLVLLTAIPEKGILIYY